MTDNNIVQLPTPKNVLAARYRSAYERSQRGHDEWIAGVLEMAETLCEARDTYDNDREFSIWIASEGLDFHSHQDRAALINMHRNRVLTEIVLQETQRTSLQHIWFKEIQPRVTQVSKPLGVETLITKTTAPASPEPVKADDPDPLRTKNRGTLGKTHPFHGMPRADEIAAIYQHSMSRWLVGGVLKKRGGAVLWDLILTAVDAGFLTPHSTHPKEPTIRLLFPTTPARIAGEYLLSSSKVLADIRDRIMPILLDNREALLAAPDQFHLIVKRHEESQRQHAMVVARNERLVTARRALPSNETEVVLYGKHFWPIVDIADPDQRYDYQQLQAAAWFFDEALKLARNGTDNSPKSCGMKIRFLVKQFTQFNNTMPPGERKRWRQVLALVVDLTRVVEQAGPDAEIGNRMPLLPSEEA